MTDYVLGPDPESDDHAADAGASDVDEADASSEHADQRARLVAAAQAGWIDALTDLGGRNTLLYHKDCRAGTLDLAAACGCPAWRANAGHIPAERR